eukprot:c12597_g1_i1.p1 GENE.c12597_g1_i1~~c12597_g1_i1.p1  ORF type:complete len:465 (+),score=200.58 c12597_g1_i1:35-1429(+)
MSKIITFEEVEKHNRHDDAWLIIHGKVYDVTKWSKTHPGGDIILLGAGTDSTILYESYHARDISPDLLAKFCVGTLDPKTAYKTYYEWDENFYPTLKKRVVEYFKKRNLSTRGGLVPKALTILAFYIFGGYLACVGGGWISWLGAIIWGIASTHIGLGIMHDGNHGAFSPSPFLNKVAGWGMDFIGASGYVWEFQHVVGHHQYTNLQADSAKTTNPLESDPDTFSSYPYVRMHEYNKRHWYNKYQHIYAPFLFGLMTLSKVFLADITAMLAMKIPPSEISMSSRMSNKLNVFRFYFMKAITLTLHIGLPVYYQGIGKGLGLYLIGHLVCSFYLATCFVVNHISEGCSFQVHNGQPTTPIKQQLQLKSQGKAQKSAKPKDWAALQIRSCVNWSTGSTFWNHFSGGLNHQVEHHLFPGISHIHYPAISKIVKETCVEYGVPYVTYNSFAGAWWDMITYLHYLGTKN